MRHGYTGEAAMQLKTGIPALLKYANHEPTVGLHFIASHVHRRGVLTMAQIRDRLDIQTSIMKNTTTDVDLASEALALNMKSTQSTLSNIQRTVSQLVERLTRKEEG